MAEKKMKVLWLSLMPAMYEEKKTFGWIAALENAVHKYLDDKIELGIAFEYDCDKLRREDKNSTHYYLIPKKYKPLDWIKRKVSAEVYWAHLKKYTLKVIDVFKPDLIHCFGCEWPIGMIASCTYVPVVIHIQGVLNVINMSEEMAIPYHERIRLNRFHPVRKMKSFVHQQFKMSTERIEREVFRCNRYFMGRTDWDRNIVKYFSPGSVYFHVPEVIRPEIYDSKARWSYKGNKKLRLITVSQASHIKGNGVILQTARILKNICHMEVEWRITGGADSFELFEKKTGISRESVGIKHLGMIDAKRVVEELTEADFYVHPSIIDNSPNSLCEAQMIGCPVIAANVGGIPQLVEEGKTGFLYPHNEPHTLAFKICNLYKEKELLERVSANEIKISHDRHEPQKTVQVLFDTYKEIVGKTDN